MKITEEMVQALAWLRTGWDGDNSEYAIEAFGVLDNGGIFAPIDEHTGYDVDPESAPGTFWRVLISYRMPGDDGVRHYRGTAVAITAEEAKAQVERDFRTHWRNWRKEDVYPQVVGYGVIKPRKDPAEWGDLSGYAPLEGRS